MAYLPALLRASAVTLVLSCLSMGLAVLLGVLIASGRVYGSPALRAVLTGYVELMRGTPLLLQLFVLYYGIAAAIRLPAFGAAALGLALNYAAYESEIYRSALEAIPTGQLEAARTLGFTERSGAEADPRAAGVPAGAGADDQRLRGAAQGLVAGLGPHRDGADQADADLRHQPGKLGHPRRAVRGALPGDVAAAVELSRAGWSSAGRRPTDDGDGDHRERPASAARQPSGARRGRRSRSRAARWWR